MRINNCIMEDNREENTKNRNIAYINTLNGSMRYAEQWFNIFLRENNLRGLNEDIYKKHYDYYIVKCEANIKKNNFWNDYYNDRSKQEATGEAGVDLLNRIYFYKFRTKFCAN